MFGTKGTDGKPLPFHLYSMRQAIDEGFILDVLKHYTTYKSYFGLIKSIEDDPEVALVRRVVLAANSIKEKAKEQAQAEGLVDTEEEILKTMLKRGRQPNISFFAFTATPK